MKKRSVFLALILPLTLAASTGWWLLFSPGRIDKEVWVEKDEVFCGAVFSPLDSTDTLGRADQRWPGQWNQMINCSTYFRKIETSGKFYIIDAYPGQLYGLRGYAKNTEIVHDVGKATGVRGDGICTEEYSLEAVGVRGYGKNEGDGDAYGGYFYGYSDGTGTHYGTYTESDNFGIFAKTTNPSKNWAGYFEGNVNITDTAKAKDFVGHHSGLSDSAIYADTANHAHNIIDIDTLLSSGASIIDPATVQDTINAPVIFRIDSAWTNGIRILQCGISTDNSSTYSVNFEDWDSRNDGSPVTIATIATSSSYEIESGALTYDLAAGHYLAVDLPTTAGTNNLFVWFRYYKK